MATKTTHNPVVDRDENAIPDGWAIVPIGSLCRLMNGRAFKPSEWTTTGLPIIRIQNLNNLDAKFNLYSGPIAPRFSVKTGDLLFAWSGTPGTSFGAHIWKGGPAVLNQHIFRVDFPEELIDKGYLRLAINQRLDDLIDAAHGGAGLAHVTKGVVESTELRVAPLREQQRIEAAVAMLLQQVSSCRARLERVPAFLAGFRHAVLAAASSGRLTEDWRELSLNSARAIENDRSVDTVSETVLPESWKWSTVERMCDPKRALTYGVIKLGPAVPDGVPTLRSSDVRPLRIERHAVKSIAPNIAAQFSRTKLHGGEVVVTVRGTLGGVAVVPDDMAGWNVSREVAVLPVARGQNARFLQYMMASPMSQTWLGERSKGVAYTGINISDLRQLPIPIPAVDEQEEIVCRVERLLGLANVAERRVRAASIRAARLAQLIPAKAFRGELVPTEAELAATEGRSYETAEELLERLKRTGEEQRDPTATGTRRRRSHENSVRRVAR